MFEKSSILFGMKRTIHILAVLLVVGIIVGCRVAPSSTARTQIEKWSTTNSGRDHFTLSEIQDLLPWSNLYVFGPYTPTPTMNQALGFEWQDAKRFNLDSRDDIHLAVFVSNSNVVRVEEWPRGGFGCGPVLTGRGLSAKTVIQIDRSRPLRVLTIAEPDGAANWSEPIRPNTNRTSSAAVPDP